MGIYICMQDYVGELRSGVFLLTSMHVAVRAHALHYQSTTQQWYCITATLLRCICHPHRYIYTQMATTGFGGTITIIGVVYLHKVLSENLTFGFGSVVLILCMFWCPVYTVNLVLHCSTPPRICAYID